MSGDYNLVINLIFSFINSFSILPIQWSAIPKFVIVTDIGAKIQIRGLFCLVGVMANRTLAGEFIQTG